MIRTITIMIVSACCLTAVDANPPAFQSLRRKIKREREAAQRAQEAADAQRASESGARHKVIILK